MSRIRVAIGLLAVAAGSAWFATRAGGLRASGEVLLDVAPYAVVLAGVLLLLRAAAPKGALAGPLLVILVGGCWLAIDRGALGTGSPGREQLLPVALVVVGSIVALVPSVHDPLYASVITRVGAVLWPRERELSGEFPQKLVVYAVFSTIRVDLTEMEKPHRMEIDFRVLCGRVDLKMPGEWKPLVPGRVVLTPGVRFQVGLDDWKRQPEQLPEIVIDAIGLVGVVCVERVESKVVAESDRDARRADPSSAS